MEFIRSVPITGHCDRLRVDNRARLAVCAAGVLRAHQEAIIHRDLKPSNALVSVDDGEAAAPV